MLGFLKASSHTRNILFYGTALILEEDEPELFYSLCTGFM